MRYSRDKIRLVNMLLAVVCAVLAFWIVSLWIRPLPSPYTMADEKEPEAAVKEVAKIKAKSAGAYAVLENKDLFRSSRRKYVAPKAPKPVKVAAPAPPPPPPPPVITLVGTLFLDDGWAALIVYGGSEASYYKVGDTLRDFTIKEIDKNYIVINRGTETVRYDMEKEGKTNSPGRLRFR